MSKDIGNKGEKIAYKYLKKQGFKILERNYRAVKGEIDIIGKENEHLVFIEVKTNNSSSDIPPELRVNVTKQRQVSKVARAYLQRTGTHDVDCRFDVVGVTLEENGKHSISHIRNAF